MKIAQALGLLLAALATQAGANTVYSYQGENYDFLSGDNPNIPGSYTTDMSVVIRFELAAPIAPNTTIAELTNVLSYSFSDGRFVKTTQSADDLVRFTVGIVNANQCSHRKNHQVPGIAGQLHEPGKN